MNNWRSIHFEQNQLYNNSYYSETKISYFCVTSVVFCSLICKKHKKWRLFPSNFAFVNRIAIFICNSSFFYFLWLKMCEFVPLSYLKISRFQIITVLVGKRKFEENNWYFLYLLDIINEKITPIAQEGKKIEKNLQMKSFISNNKFPLDYWP